MKIAIIGGGAAGFMAAITAKSSDSSAEVVLFEKSDKVLSKVKISGGGRCNVTHACFNISELTKHYPRGKKFLKKSFAHFYTKDTVDWFEERGVKLKIEDDKRMFPDTNSSQSIIDCLMGACTSSGVSLNLKSTVKSVLPQKDKFILKVNEDEIAVDRLIIATGGSPKLHGLKWLIDLNYEVEKPVPSLFTFNMPNESIKELMGVVATDVSVHIQGNKLKHTGPLLITHWGMSGPAILKCSAWGARELAHTDYRFNIQLNWANLSENDYVNLIKEHKNSNRIIANKNPFNLPNRLWLFLLKKIHIDSNISWNQLDKKSGNRLLNVLFNDSYQVNGKTTFKEEFVTCGGISLNQVNPQSLESKKHKGLYFCGEVLDIDGVTGGFNFQSAWTTGYLAGKNSVL
ncbi:NAD(P)/FAD-dependent oxidoreductase [Flavobacteriales bacterium]|nr:NAD(P)/FAD-dependent oxidoreductase [Flavobacteriales bacterium]